MNEFSSVENPLGRPDFREVCKELDSVRGWLKFIGIVTLVGGILQAFTIIGILFAWLPIWMGILLMNASKNAKEFSDYKDTVNLTMFVGNLRKYFVIQGIKQPDCFYSYNCIIVIRHFIYEKADRSLWIRRIVF